jgi:diguanylate cyclase (GGDEF)-like protein/PAS domain S-box-containing protein
MWQRRSLLLPYVVGLAVVVGFLPTIDDLRPGPVVAGLVLQLLVGVLLTGVDRVGSSRWIALAGAMGYLLSVALLREGMGAFAGCGPLVLLPVMWMALQRRRAEMLVLLGAVALLFALPILLVGAPDYPATGWRVGALLLVVAATLGASVLALVDELHQEADRSAAILAAMSEGFGLTCDGRIIAVNRALCAITGLSAQQLIGSRAPFPFWPEELSEETEAVRRSIVAANGGTFELLLRHADGHRFPASITATPTLLSDGRHAFVNTVRDITERRAHEDALRHHAEQLEAIAHVAREVGHCDPRDTRRTVCRTAIAVGQGAHTAMIWEREANGDLRSTAADPERSMPFTVAAHEAEHGAQVVLRTGAPLYVADATTSPHCAASIVADIGAKSVLFVPISDGEATRGVIALSWPAPRPSPSPQLLLVIGVLADEAAIAMQRADLLARLDELTRTDDLTGLPNRRAWDEILARELASARRSGQPLSVAMLDLDFFKRYNDERGHLAGDRLLQQGAAAWAQQLRASDVLARWGGEEFVLLLPDCDGQHAHDLVERLRGSLPHQVTFSAGIVSSDGTTAPRALVDAADQALYEAKANGRDCIVIA